MGVVVVTEGGEPVVRGEVIDTLCGATDAFGDCGATSTDLVKCIEETFVITGRDDEGDVIGTLDKDEGTV
jgi:hypothetical protein